MSGKGQRPSDIQHLVRDEFESAWTDGDFDVVGEQYDPEVAIRIPWADAETGREDYRNYVEKVRGSFADLEPSVGPFHQVGDVAAAEVELSGEYSESFKGDDESTLWGTHVFRFEDSQVTERWGTFLPKSKIKRFESSFRGDVLRPGDEAYDDARSVWNEMIDRYPSIIARCTGTSDVIEAVDFARENGLLVAVHAGGHSVAGHSVCNGGIVIDVSEMTGVRVDPRDQTAQVQPGVTWGLLDHETQRHGLAVPGGIVSTTGVAGLTLGGGYGWLSRAYGLTCDNLRSVDIVTADGELRHASESENSDLFWGLRGGGGNFGIVTSFEFELHEVGPAVFAGDLLYRLEDAEAVLRNYREFCEEAPREFTCYVGFHAAPELPMIPEELHGEPTLGLRLCYAGDPSEGKRHAEPLLSFGDPICNLTRPIEYKEFQAVRDPNWEANYYNYWKSNYVDGLSDGAIEKLVSAVRELPSRDTEVSITQMGGAIADVPPDGSAYPHREAPFLLSIDTRWADEDEEDRHIDWARSLYEDLKPHYYTGTYANYLADEGEDRVKAAYGQNYERLVQIKDQYDPENLFSLNQNVTPSDE